MKFYCLVCCFLFLVVGDVCSQIFSDSPIDDYSESEDYDEESFKVDYPQVTIRNYDENINPQENEIETEVDSTKPESKTPVEVDQPENTYNVFEPLPDVESASEVTLENKVDKLFAELKAVQNKISQLEDSNNKLILKIDSIEQQTKTNSIILTNVPQKPNESSKVTLQKVLNVLNRVMKVRIAAKDISVALRAQSSSGKTAPILIRFTNFANKMRVLAASNRLAHTNMTVSSDYSELVAQKRAALMPYLAQARADGHRAFIYYDRLSVNGEMFTLEALQSMPREVQATFVSK